LALYIKALVEPGHIDWMKLIDLMSTRPARIIKLDRGTLNEGVIADVTIIDPKLEWTIDLETMKTKSRNCPFGG